MRFWVGLVQSDCARIFLESWDSYFAALLATKDTKIKIGGRHAELHICKVFRLRQTWITDFDQELETRVIYISRGQPCNARGLREATEAAAGMFSHLFFVDGGGDSLILQRRKKVYNSLVSSPYYPWLVERSVQRWRRGDAECATRNIECLSSLFFPPLSF